MSNKIKKIDFIKNMAVFNDFQWDSCVLDKGNKVCEFEAINILYGLNYSGKTTLSRIFRAMETGTISTKYNSPQFQLSIDDSATGINQNCLNAHSYIFRVFNEDFVRENLRFITNPDDSIEPFAILGADNNKIEKEIEALEQALGSSIEGQETGLSASRKTAKRTVEDANKALNDRKEKLEKKLNDKATGTKTGIKYQSEFFGDQNYNLPKLNKDIQAVLNESYQSLPHEQKSEHKQTIKENILDAVNLFGIINLQFHNLSEETHLIITKKVGESGKIDELTKDALLNRWAKEGQKFHQGKHDHCAFCGNHISNERWQALEKHFDEESERLEKDIDALIIKIKKEESASSTLKINKNLFYSKFHQELDTLIIEYEAALRKYCSALNSLLEQLEDRKKDILHAKDFRAPEDLQNDLRIVWDSYNKIISASNSFTGQLNSAKNNAKLALRLQEVSDFLVNIEYREERGLIDKLTNDLTAANSSKGFSKNKIHD